MLSQKDTAIVTTDPEETYFSVSTSKFIIMSLGTMGLYNLFWQYKNWCLLKSSKSLDIMPFWRAFFAPLWAYSLFGYIFESAAKNNIPSLKSPALLGICYFLLAGSWSLPDPYWVVTYLSLIPLLIANTTVTKINATNNNFQQNNVIKLWQLIVTIPVILLTIVIIFK